MTNTDAKMKRSYASPQLKAFGSVRNLTGGSQGSMNDITNMTKGNSGKSF